MNDKELMDKWRKMSVEEKCRWNGYQGFKQQISFEDSSAFKPLSARREKLK